MSHVRDGLVLAVTFAFLTAATSPAEAYASPVLSPVRSARPLFRLNQAPVTARAGTRSTRSGGRIAISRIDQSSRYALVSNLRPGGRVELYANGFLAGVAYPRGTVARVNFRRPLLPGSRVAVVERFAATPSYDRAFATVQVDYTTYHFDNQRTGWNAFEQTLVVKNIRLAHFGILFNLNLDADVLAQPLYVGGLDMGVLGVHNVVYAATENDTVYAFDADTGAALWTTSLVNPGAGITAVPVPDIGNCRNIQPAIGITSTPVIDPATNTMYVEAKIEVNVGSKSWHHMLHALDITTGLDKVPPVEIMGSVLTGGGKTITFTPRWAHQRPALLLSNGVVYVGFGSHCDFHGPLARGWIFGFAADTLAPVAQFLATQDDDEGFGSLWQSGFGFATDDDGAIYALTGNGAYDGQTSFSDSVLKLRPDLTVADFFTPFDYQQLDDGDVDLGSGGPMVIPHEGGAYPDMVVAAGKSRNIYLLNRGDLGGLTTGGPDRVIQFIGAGIGRDHGVWGGPAYYVGPTGNQYIYYCGGQDHLKAFQILTSPQTMLMLAMQSQTKFVGEGGTIPVVSSNGSLAGTGIVWTMDRPTAKNPVVKLLAFDANNLPHKLIAITAGTYDNTRGGLFGVPTVIAGKVFMSTGRSIAVFGLH